MDFFFQKLMCSIRSAEFLVLMENHLVFFFFFFDSGHARPRDSEQQAHMESVSRCTEERT